MVHVGVQATPVSAWRAAHDNEWPLGSEDADDPITILRPIEVPGRTPRARTQVERSSREDSETRPPLSHA
eukprot:5443123-Alexandrium_andersonii.AAC.1